MRCLRAILNVSWRDHIRNEEIRLMLGMENTIIDDIRKRRLRWFGHVQRRPPDSLVYGAYHQDFTNPRPRGRPPKRWRDQIVQDTGWSIKYAERKAKDRDAWRKKMKRSKGRVLA
ncbi:hypothetical protein Bbelb_256150 [Branchiostoma belcheri]|nr:hypothetical protein Bbelb_256150 [Branchiostoma belcheri]